MAVKDARPSPFTQLTTQADWEGLISALGLQDGINDTVGGPGLQPGLDTVGRNATMGAGAAVIKGQLWSCDTTQLVSIPAPSGLNRIDRLVLRYDRAAASSAAVVAPALIAGTPASGPVEPSLTRTTSGAYDIPIASWLSASSGALTSFVDERQFNGRNVPVGLSTNRPSLTLPTLFIESDTGKLMLWNGTAWVTVSADQYGPWTPFSASLLNGWVVRNPVYTDCRVRRAPGNKVEMAALWFAGAVADLTTIGFVPAVDAKGNNLRPLSTQDISIVSDALRMPGGTPNNPEGAQIRILTDGTIQCLGLGSTASRIAANISYFLDPM